MKRIKYHIQVREDATGLWLPYTTVDSIAQAETFLLHLQAKHAKSGERVGVRAVACASGDLYRERSYQAPKFLFA
jgi:hypothetical protein